MASLPSPTLVSLEKKRARDRRAQRNFRHRRNDHISMLEGHLRACNEQIASLIGRIRYLENTCSRQEAKLLEDHACDGRSTGSCQTDFLCSKCQPRSLHHTNLSLSRCSWHYEPQSAEDHSCRLSDSIAIKAFLPSPTYERATDMPGNLLPSISRMPPQKRTALYWSFTPLQVPLMWDALPMYSPWGADIRMVQESPEFPTPLELLYGSRTNKLANFIHDNSRLWGCHDPERLACGWLNYALAKWTAEPSECRFKRMPEFLRPVAEQLKHAHPACIDIVVFPQLRVNLITKQHLYNLNEVLGMLSCCIKVRWPWGKCILTPGDDANLHISPEFYDTFMQLGGWGLTAEFISTHAELLDKIDIESVYFEASSP